MTWPFAVWQSSVGANVCDQCRRRDRWVVHPVEIHPVGCQLVHCGYCGRRLEPLTMATILDVLPAPPEELLETLTSRQVGEMADVSGSAIRMRAKRHRDMERPFDM